MNHKTKHSLSRRWLIPVCASLALHGLAHAQTPPQPSATEPSSQWMTGFPPAPERIIRNSDTDFFAGEYAGIAAHEDFASRPQARGKS